LSHPDRSRPGSGRGRGGGPDSLTRIRRALRDQIRHSEFLEERLRAVLAERDAAVAASRKGLDAIVDCSPEAIITLDRGARVLEWNPAAERLFGWKREEVIGKPYPLVDDMLRADFEEGLKRMFRGERVCSREIQRRHKDGRLLDVSLSNAPMYSRDGEIIGVIGILVDRTEVKALTERVEMLAQTVEQSPNLVFITDRDRVIRYVNPRFVELTGYVPEEVLGRSAQILDSGITPAEVMSGLIEALCAGVEFRGELVNRRRNGELFTVSCRVCPVRDAGGAVTAFVHHQEDISSLQTLREALDFQSTHDALTGLANRAAFEMELAALLDAAMRDSGVHALAWVDLDQAEILAANYGPDALNSAMQTVATVMTKVTRRTDLVARVGDDEFGVLLRYCRPRQAERLAATLRDAVRQTPLTINGETVRVTVCVGLAPLSRHSKDAVTALSDARTACRLAKERGRDCYVTLTEADAEVRKRRGEMEWTTRIVRAMEQDRMFLVWQPIVSLKKGATPRHYEVLLRLRGEDGEVIMPGSFLPAVQRYGLSVRLDGWVIDHALRWLSAHPAVLKRIGMCTINLSGDSVGHPEIRDLVMRLIRELDLPGEKLCFEITETAAVANFAEARRFILTLRERGCRFAIDDFGSGVSSFGYLKHLPVDFLKIDGAFIRHVADDGFDSVLVRSMNEVGHALGKKTIAEFVEDDRILRVLKKMGVDFAQGYAIGRPEPLA
jgi:diguanylate cyclase (GGDEF)-like protein/PAS domain S-box-containing protein